MLRSGKRLTGLPFFNQFNNIAHIPQVLFKPYRHSWDMRTTESIRAKLYQQV